MFALLDNHFNFLLHILLFRCKKYILNFPALSMNCCSIGSMENYYFMLIYSAELVSSNQEGNSTSAKKHDTCFEFNLSLAYSSIKHIKVDDVVKQLYILDIRSSKRPSLPHTQHRRRKPSPWLYPTQWMGNAVHSFDFFREITIYRAKNINALLYSNILKTSLPRHPKLFSFFFHSVLFLREWLRQMTPTPIPAFVVIRTRPSCVHYHAFSL